MKLRPFGNTGMNVSEIGLGAWQLANPDWGVNDKKEALKIVQKSLEAAAWRELAVTGAGLVVLTLGGAMVGGLARSFAPRPSSLPLPSPQRPG